MQLFRGFAAAALFVFGSAAQAAVISQSYSFGFPRAGTCVDARQGCTPWEGGDLASYRRELHPVVPERVARLLLPEGETLDHVTLSGFEVKATAFTPEIAAQRLPLTAGAASDRRVAAYGGGAYPAAWLGEARVTRFRGYALVEVPLYPLRVLDDGKAVYIERATLQVTTRPDGHYGASERRPLVRDRLEAEALADNVPGTYARIVPPDEEVGYLILGPRELIGTRDDTPLKPLIDEKESRQINVTLTALEDVSPRKDPREIRDYIRAHYKQDQVDYVLLVGDKKHFPWKYVHSGVDDRSDPVPSDQWYACLDGDWEEPSGIDWQCEVSVGRVGAKTREDVANWAAKAVQLAQAARSGRSHSFLSFGEKLDGQTLGRRTLDYLIQGNDDHAPKTVGFPSQVQVTKLYDSFRDEVSSRDFIDTLNKGDFHVVNHLGHANETYVFRTNASDLSRFRNRPAFFYSEGCYPNDPDADNWTIRAVRMANYGPAAMIANTRFGWYEPGDEAEGTSSVLHRTFWSMRFAAGVKTIGAMNHKAKAAAVAADRSETMVYTALESNLIGDPELDLGL